MTKGYCEDALTIWKNHCAKTYATIKEKPFLDIFQLQIELPPASIQKKINKKIKKGSIIPDESLHYKFELASGEKCKEKYLYRVKSTLRNVLEVRHQKKILF